MPGKRATLYRPRRPRESPLYALVDECYDEVKGSWEERFERRYGFWRGTIEDAGFAFLDCGIYDNGFARVGCQECRAEYLVAFSCQRRGFCPSCAAKRGAHFGPFLAEEVLEDVGQCLWTFTMPKMLRGVFRHHRELLGGLCRAAWEVVRDLMATAVAKAAAQLFRHRVITLLRDEELLGERIELLLSWSHSGFSLNRSRHEGRPQRSVPLRQRREIRHACRGKPPIESSRR